MQTVYKNYQVIYALNENMNEVKQYSFMFIISTTEHALYFQ